MQRFFDILFSGLALLALSPLLVPVAILLRFTGEGEVFFLQDRVGKGGHLFKLYKFATMLKARTWEQAQSRSKTIRASCLWAVFCARPRSMSCPSCSIF